jgi:hypothetical protein
MPNPDWSSMANPPELLLRGYSASGRDMIIRTQMETGYPKARQRTTAAVRPVTGTVICDEDQYAELVAFLEVACAGGALRFDWTDPHDGAAIELRYIPQFQETPIGRGNWEVSLELEVMP